MGRKANSGISFYIIDDETQEEWYYDGHNFDNNFERCATYGTNAPKEYLEENYRLSPMYKDIMSKFGHSITDEELKVVIS